MVGGSGCGGEDVAGSAAQRGEAAGTQGEAGRGARRGEGGGGGGRAVPEAGLRRCSCHETHRLPRTVHEGCRGELGICPPFLLSSTIDTIPYGIDSITPSLSPSLPADRAAAEGPSVLHEGAVLGKTAHHQTSELSSKRTHRQTRYGTDWYLLGRL